MTDQKSDNGLEHRQAVADVHGAKKITRLAVKEVVAFAAAVAHVREFNDLAALFEDTALTAVRTFFSEQTQGQVLFFRHNGGFLAKLRITMVYQQKDLWDGRGMCLKCQDGFRQQVDFLHAVVFAKRKAVRVLDFICTQTHCRKHVRGFRIGAAAGRTA